MTQRLAQAIAEIQKLPPSDQDAIAALILEEIADDRRWDDSLSRSQDRLSQLAAKAREDIREGRVKDLGIDEL